MEILLLATTFLLLVLIGGIIVTVHFKKTIEKNQEASDKRFNELKDRIDETQALFRKEVSGILNALRGFIDKPKK